MNQNTQLAKQSRHQLITLTSSDELWTVLSDVDISPQTSLSELRVIPSNSISSLIKKSDIGVDKSEAYRFFKTMIILINQFFGISWTDYQLLEVSKEFYSCFHHWKILDAKCFMQRCRRLHYGKVYGAFSPAILMEWANSYNDEWFSVSENMSLMEHDRLKHQGSREREVQVRDQLEEARKMTQVYDQWKKSHQEYQND